MSDITMCTGFGCTLKDTCYRFTAVADPYLQSYFVETPWQQEDDEVECKYYWQDERNKNEY